MIAYIFVCLVLYVTYKYVQYYKSPLRLLPSPPVESILGFILGHAITVYKKNAGEAYLEWSLKYGGIFMVKLLGEDVVIISDPELARQVAMNPQIFTKKNWRFEHAASLFGNGILTQSDIDIHRKMRAVIGEAFSYTNLKLYFPIFTLKGKLALENLRLSVDQTIDIYETFNNCVFDVIGKAAFGCDFDTQIPNKGGNKTEGQIIAEKAKQSLNTPFGLLDATIFRTILPKNRKAYQLSHSLNQHIQDIIQHKRESIEKNTHTNFEDENQKVVQKDLLDILIQLKHEDGTTLTNSELVDEVKTFLIAGTETSVALITFTLWYIAHHPEVEEKLVNEIQTVLGSDSLPTTETLDKMKYLNNVFKESLRIMPPAPLVTRVTDSDVTLAGYLIPKRTVVNTSVYTLHNSPNLWENPEHFNPDRWEKTDVDQEFGSFIPFFLGTRNCIGQRFAGLEVKAVLSMVLRDFTFSVPPNHPEVRRSVTIVIRPKPYIKLIPHLRK